MAIRAGWISAVVLAAIAIWAPGSASADPGVTTQIAAGGFHTCALLDDGSVHCWGWAEDGRLGYGGFNEEGLGELETIGDDEVPAVAGAVDLGGHTAIEIAAGEAHTCAILDDHTVRCWGRGADGRLGYGNTDTIGDVHPPGFYGPVDLGAGRTAKEIAAGGSHTCAILDNGAVRCWGDGSLGQLGYGDTQSIGDTETPGSVGPVDLGAGRTAVQIAAGPTHTCAVLDNGAVRCWGRGLDGRLGYGNETPIGDTETPGSVGPVDLGVGRTAKSVSVADNHTCAVRDDGTVLCWGASGNGRLGYPGSEAVGDDEAPGSVGPVDLGVGRTATAISASGIHTCALLDGGDIRCWGLNDAGELGYGNLEIIGDTEAPAAAGPVEFGAGRTALAVSAGHNHTCAILDDRSVRCWGLGTEGQLGYGNTETVGDNEQLSAVGPIDLVPPSPAPGPGEPTPLPLAATIVPAPVAGKTVNVAPSAGTVTVKCPGERRFGRLAAAEQIPLGCLIDTRHGTVSLTSARAGGGTQTGLFWAGIFEVGQGGGRRAEVILTLAGPLVCGGRRAAGRAGGAGRRLWGSGEGNFKTVGKHGTAGVRGTIWLVADRCDDSTLFRVKKGVVTVRDFEKDVTVALRQGKTYIAKG